MALEIEPEDCEAGPGGKTGLRLGGLDVEIWGLKVTLRAGLVGGDGRASCEGEGRRGEDSDMAVEEAMEWVKANSSSSSQ